MAAVEVRVGSAARDQSGTFGSDGAQLRFVVPAEPAPAAEPRNKRLWLALDQAFRTATATFSQKQSILARLAGDPPPPDLGPRPEPMPRQPAPEAGNAPALDREGLRALVIQLSRRFAQHPKIDNGDVIVHLQRSHSLDIACDREGEGPVQVRRVLGGSQDRAVFGVVADAQAEDGMHLDHGSVLESTCRSCRARPRRCASAALALTDQVLRELEELLAAPMIDEDYDGPLLLSSFAAAQLLAATVPAQASGDPPPLSDYGRLVRDFEPHWQEAIGKAVMPEFIDLVDDPLAAGAGHYELDAQGVPAQRVELVRAGVLHTLLMTPTGRIRHERAATGGRAVRPFLQGRSEHLQPEPLERAQEARACPGRAREGAARARARGRLRIRLRDRVAARRSGPRPGAARGGTRCYGERPQGRACRCPARVFKIDG